MSIVDTNLGWRMDPLVVLDDSYAAGLGPTPHSGTVSKAKERAKGSRRSKEETQVMWILFGVATIYVLMRK